MAAGKELPSNAQVIGKVVRDRALQDGKRVEYRIKGAPGLCLRVYPKGDAQWSVKYYFQIDGKWKSRRYPLGIATEKTLGPAVDRAREIMTAVKTHGRDPMAEKVERERTVKSEAGSFDELFEKWLEHAKNRLKNWQQDEANYKNHLKPVIGSRVAQEIERSDVVELRDSIAKTSGPIQSNRMVALFNRVMYWAVDEGYIKANPGARIRKVGKEQSKDRILEDQYLPRFWHGLNSQSTLLSLSTLALKLTLLVGQRRGEVIGCRKDELHLDQDKPYWLIGRDRTKNGLPHVVPLCPMAVQVLQQAVQQHLDSEFVFPSPLGGQPIDGNSIRNSCERLCKSLEIPKVTPHDLRRSMSTGMARSGISETVRGRILNHVGGAKRSVTDSHYNVYDYFDEKHDALESWEAHIRTLCGLEIGEIEDSQMSLI